MILAETLMKNHPAALDNFRLGYEYAISKNGLKLSKEQAINFGKQMAAMSVLESAQKQTRNKTRVKNK